MAVIALLAILLSFFASHVAAQNTATSSNTAAAFGGLVSTALDGFNNATSFLATATLPNVFGTHTSSVSSSTGPFSNNTVNTTTKNSGKVIGITVGIIFGCFCILFGIVLWVYIRRQRNRKAWYRPTAEFYRNGGHTGGFQEGFQPGQPLLNSAAKSFISSASSPAPSSTLYPALHYQSSLSPSTQYDSEVNYGHVSPSPQYGLSPTSQHDPNAIYRQPYSTYYDSRTGTPHTGYATPIIQE